MRFEFRFILITFLLVCSALPASSQNDDNTSRTLLAQIFSKLGWGPGNAVTSLTATGRLQIGNDVREVVIEGRRDGSYYVKFPATGAYTKVTRQRGVIFDGEKQRELQPQEIATAQPWLFPFLTDFSRFGVTSYKVQFLAADAMDSCRPIELTPPKDLPFEQATGPLTFCFRETDFTPVKLSFDRMAADTRSAHVRVSWKLSDFRNNGLGLSLPYHIEEWVDGQNEFTLTISNIQINSASDSDFTF